MLTHPRLLAALILVTPPITAQSIPREAARAGPTPARVGLGEPAAFVREFDAARQGDELRVVYTENGPGGRATLRSALFRRDGAALVRLRPDLTLAPDARTLALAWAGPHGAVAYVIPRRPPPPSALGAPRRRAPAVGVPPSTRDPLGPSNLSGGELVVQRLAPDGAALGRPIAVFTENARLARVSAAWIGDRLVVAWTGGAVTDDEVRVTVRARSLDAAGSLSRASVTHTGLLGDIGDTLHIAPDIDGGALLSISASHCAATTSPPSPLAIPDDPSVHISPPRRVLMPQQPTHDAPGPAIACAPLALHRVRLSARDEVIARHELVPLSRDLAAPQGDQWVVSLRTEAGPALARASTEGDTVSWRSLDGAPLRPIAPPSREQDLALRRPSAAEPDLVEAAVAPVDRSAFDLRSTALLAACASGALVTVAEGRRVLHLLSSSGVPRVLATSPRGVAAIRVLDGEAPWLLSREGQWSGALRWTPLDAPAAAWPEASPFATPPAAPERYPATTPYVWDESLARLWTRARTARAVFMRHENTAGAMAARPEAPSDPRMPGVIAVRSRLRNRWEGACGQLRTRAGALARQGAGQDLMRGVQQLCELHADLQLGVPVNPAL